MLSLSEKVIAFNKGEESYLDEILLFTQLFFFHYPLDHKAISEDNISEFYLKLQHRFLSIIQRYIYDKVSFESYLKSIIKMEIRLFNKILHEKKRQEMNKNLSLDFNALYASEADDAIHSSSTLVSRASSYDAEKEESLSKNDCSINDKQLRILAICCAPELKQKHLDALSLYFKRTLNIDFYEDYKKALDIFSKRSKRINSLICSKNHQFYNLINSQRDFNQSLSLGEDPKRDIDKFQRAHRLYLNHLEKLNKSKRCLTHKEVSEVLNISKGTINCMIKKIKDALAHLSKKD